MVASVASNEIVAFEHMLQPLKPHFAQALAGTIPVERLMRSIVISVERLPKLLECTRQSLLNAAMSAACLGLEVDGVTGQAFLIPFKGRAQLVIGYKGMNTMAARSGYTVQGEVVRDGDFFEYELGDKGYVRHKPKLGNRSPIIAAWATASALDRPAIISVLGIDDLMAIKAKSPGAARGDSPWNDMAIGFPAMCAKSAKRRLARSMPLNVMHRAAVLDEAYEERGKGAWIDPDKGVQIEGEVIDDALMINHEQRDTATLLAPREEFKSTDVIPSAPAYIEQWRVDMMNATKEADAIRLGKKWNAEKILRDQITDWPEGSFEDLKSRVARAIESLKAPA